MKEYIFQIDNVSAGNDIVVANAPTGLAVKNILAIINKTTGKPVHSPIAQVIDAVTYSGTTMTITLDSNAPSIEGNLLIKAYTDDAAGGYDEMLAEFFGVTVLQGYEFMTDTEVTDELEDIMQALDPDLTAEQAASITAQAMQIINPSES